MAYVDIPAGEGSEMQRIWELSPAFAEVDRVFRTAVQDGTILPASEVEVARMRIAQINDCHY
jgi:alkylhydroperoxidase family enzyme